MAIPISRPDMLALILVSGMLPGLTQPSLAQSPSDSRMEAWLKSEEQRRNRFLNRVGPLAERAGFFLPDSADHYEERRSSAALKSAETSQEDLSPELLLTAPIVAIPNQGQYFPGETRLRFDGPNQSGILQMFDTIRLSGGAAAGVKIGDLFRVYDVGHIVRTHKEGKGLGRLIETKGVIEVTEVFNDQAVGRLIRCFGTISTSTRACPLVYPESVPVINDDLASDSKLGHIVHVTHQQSLAQPYTFIIVDGGAGRGFRAGNRVDLMNRLPAGQKHGTPIARGIVASMGDNWTTIFVHEVFPGRIQAGDWAQSPLNNGLSRR